MRTYKKRIADEILKRKLEGGKALFLSMDLNGAERRLRLRSYYYGYSM